MATTNLLLIDDEAPFIDAMSRRLTKRGLNISTACSGYEALECLEKSPSIEVAVLDVKMPGMDGIETLQKIKQKFPLVEVIMLTGHATVESAIDGMKMGAFDYLMKPCDMNQLVSKVEAASAKKQQHEEKIIDARVKEITSRQAG